MAKKKPARPVQKTGQPVPPKVHNPPETGRDLMGRPYIAPSPASPPPDPRVIYVQEQAAGSSGVRIYAGYFSEEYLINELHGTVQADEYDRMRRSDAKVKMSLKAVKDPIIAANWEIHPAGDDKEHQLHADFIDHVLFKGMDRPFNKNELLSLADFGFYVLEITHKPVFGHPVFGDYIGIKSLGWRSPRSILYWRLNPQDGCIDHVRQLITGDLERFVDIPGQFLLVGSLEKEGDNYEGVALVRSCYGAWKRKNLYLRLMAIGGERNAVPTPVLEVPDGKQNSAEYANAVRVLQNYTSHQNSWVAFPAGWKYTFLNSNFDPEKLKSMIDFENSEIVSAFMANFLLLGSTQSGSRAVSMDQSEFFLGAIQLLADEACKPFNHKLIPELIKMKFGPQDAYPELRVSGISDKAGQELAESLSKLAISQYIQPDDQLEDHLRKRYQLPKKSDKGVRIVQAPKAMQQGDDVTVTDHPDQADPHVQAAESRLPGRITLASVRQRAKKAKAHIPQAKDQLRAVMQKNVETIAQQMVQDIMAAKKKLPAARRRSATANVEPKGTQAYKAELRDALTSIAKQAESHARHELPAKKSVKLTEEHPTIQLTEFDDLPPDVQAKIIEQSNLIVNTQMADLQKTLFFQYATAVDSTGDDAVLENDLDEAAEAYLDGNTLTLGAANSASAIVNEARNAFFFHDDVLDGIQAMQFVNGDPQCPVCQDLNGSTFDPNDASAQRYYPPLHHNCACILVPIPQGDKQVEITGLKPSKADLEDYITFGEPVDARLAHSHARL